MSKNYNLTLQTNNSSLEQIITQLNNMPDAGESLDTSDATATSGDILSGKTAYVDGEKVTGTIASKTASNLTASGATVTVPAGHYATQATKSVATATQATPSITVSSAGLITASSTQSAGYVAAGTKSGTKQLTTQAAKTVTPTTSNQTAVASGRYTIGAITVKGDANLKAENIAEGVSIFGVTGTHTGGEDLDSVITELETKVATLNTTLDGKASGGSGSGGGNVTVQTCTVTFLTSFVNNLILKDGSLYLGEVAYTAVNNGVLSYGVIALNSETSIDNVVSGAMLIIYGVDTNKIDYLTIETDGEASLECYGEDFLVLYIQGNATIGG